MTIKQQRGSALKWALAVFKASKDLECDAATPGSTYNLSTGSCE
jgi:hypothetical protein